MRVFVIIAAQQPGWVKIYLKKADGKALGETYILYYDKELEAFEVVVQSPRLQAHLFRKWADNLETRSTTTSTGGEAQHFGICGEWRNLLITSKFLENY